MSYETHTTPTDRLARLNTEIERHTERLQYYLSRGKRFEGGIRYHRANADWLIRERNEVLEEMKEQI